MTKRWRFDALVANFSVDDASAVKAIEATTNHDVKAVEYWIKDKFKALPELKMHAEFVHFASHLGRHQQRLHADAEARCARRAAAAA